MNIILASKSPRRKQLLEDAGFNISVQSMDVDESFPNHINVDDVAEYIAIKKADAAQLFLKNVDDVVIASDTVVIHQNQILGKPKDREEAMNILSSLSGEKHKVVTGVCLKSLDKMVSFSDTAYVWFNPISKEEISFYIDKYQPYDKAGSYGIQEWLGLCKIRKIEGTYTNIMGLPVHKIYEELVKWK